MGRTLGIHVIATTHGTWLHGDVRGSWANGRLTGPDPFLEAAIRSRMTSDAVVLSPAEVAAVAADMGATILEQGHRAYAATFASTHLHIVFAPLPEDVKTTIARLKKRSAALILGVRRQRGDDRRHLWTQGRFPVFVFDPDHLTHAIEYVRRHNVRIGLPPDPHDWIEPLYPPRTPHSRAILARHNRHPDG
jgi:REP element-mobilizing transposase RayT